MRIKNKVCAALKNVMNKKRKYNKNKNFTNLTDFDRI